MTKQIVSSKAREDKESHDKEFFTPLDIKTLKKIIEIVGEDSVLDSYEDRLKFSRDRLPFTTFHLRAGTVTEALPSAVVKPRTEDELINVLAVANKSNIAVIAYGAGLGVLGGALPVCGEIIINLENFLGLPKIDQENRMVTVSSAFNGGELEKLLNEEGYTCGHHPQSLHISTVGGWVACRGAGQMSSRYGKIEDMVLGVRALLPEGKVVDIKPVSRRSVGPGILDFLIGSEGTIGILTQVTLKIWKLPEVRLPAVVAFPSLAAGLTAMREIMQADLRPSVARLYDAQESKEKAHKDDDLSVNPIMCILEFVGSRKLANTEFELGLEICARHGAIKLSNQSYEKWQKVRFESYSAEFIAKGGYVETIEITGLWTKIPVLYEEIKSKINELDERIYFGAHWSHIYSEGSCQYMTFRIPNIGDEDLALKLHLEIWKITQTIALKHAASIAHHHGAGVFRNPWIEEELGGGLEIIKATKRGLDPNNILNPGKLGLPARPGSVLPTDSMT